MNLSRPPGLTGPLGTDLALMDTAQMVLKKAGLPTAVKAGKVMYV